MLVYYVLIYAGLRSLLTSPGVYTMPMEHDDGVNDAPGLPRPDYPRVSVEVRMKRILKIMETKGLDYKNSIEPRINQYLVVTVLSYEEFQRDDFTTSASIPENRTQVLLNLNTTGLPSYYGDTIIHKVHGEMLALYFNKTIDVFLRLLDVQVTAQMSNLPYVFVYSYYIPCAGLTIFHYSCAEELANAGRVNRDRYRLIVGYNDSYSNTNVSLALQYLTEGGISSLINIKTGDVYQDRPRIERRQIYQQKMVDCLMDRSIPYFYLKDAAYIVNHVVKQCIKNSNRYGYITQFGKAQLDECVRLCSCIDQNYELKYCSHRTLGTDVRLMFGEPIDICIAEWKATTDDLKWRDLYTKYTQIPGTHSVGHINARTKQSNKLMKSLCTEQIKEYEKNRQTNNYVQNVLKGIQSDFKSDRQRPPPKVKSVCPLRDCEYFWEEW